MTLAADTRELEVALRTAYEDGVRDGVVQLVGGLSAAIDIAADALETGSLEEQAYRAAASALRVAIPMLPDGLKETLAR
jgi:hypothetical protein